MVKKTIIPATKKLGKELIKEANLEHIYFVVGNGEIENPPFNPKLLFASSIEYKVRKSFFGTTFGILIS